MRVILVRDYEEMSERAAEIVIEAIREKPDLNLAGASGSTPRGLYERLAAAGSEGLDCSSLGAFTLDEYVGLGPEHPQSLRRFMDEVLFDNVNIPDSHIHSPDGLSESLHQTCAQYERLVQQKGGIDVFVLGIGRDGHIGFNEPGTSLGSGTHVTGLAPETVEDNARFFDNVTEVPRFAITMGIQTILDGDLLLLMANGANKARAVARALEGPVTASVTASALQFHPNVVAVVDAEAAANLKRRDYYRWEEDSRPMIEDKL
jgi:glucosamine-6-phosphate deaminase